MIEINRWYHDDCVIGRLRYYDFQCFTLELPDLNNQSNISCIPDGQYKVKKYDSPSKGNVILLENVPNRTYIEIHAGNFTRQILGCILVGDSIRWLDKDKIPDVANSKNTLRKLLNLFDDRETLEIT